MERLIPPQPNPTTLYTGPLKLGATMTIEVTYYVSSRACGRREMNPTPRGVLPRSATCELERRNRH